ncbi:helix-turn-helix domain-containing protein [Burkholderia gladioli]|uniref:helix-turn-helix domain-containing protein n=1 Tax=Burkholderia gladioli TaxID=28095 RepID=UPI001CC3538A|nr:helix-turn-helix transcriptional regulator [Burkholderia gladioli]
MNAQTLIADLMRSGLTQMEIERRSGVDQSTVSGLYTGKRGKRVSYEVVKKLETLHGEVFAGADNSPKEVA